MSRNHSLSRSSCFTGLIAFGMLLLCPEISLALSITERSPFVPADFKPPSGQATQAASKTSPQGLQFKGMYQLNDTMYFLVREQNKMGKWRTIGELEEDDIKIARFDSEDNRLLVDVSGKEVWLDLSETAALTGSSNPTRSTRTPGRPTITRPTTASSSSRGITTRRPTITRPSSSSAPASSLARSLQRRRPTSFSRSSSSRSSSRTPPVPAPTTGLPSGPAPITPPTAFPEVNPGAPPQTLPADPTFN